MKLLPAETLNANLAMQERLDALDRLEKAGITAEA